MTYKRGVFTSEIPTALVAPRKVDAGIPVYVGTSPINLAINPKINTPAMAYTYQEAVEQLGYQLEDWDKYTLCEAIYAHFVLFPTAPVFCINVLDPAQHKKAMQEQTVVITNGRAKINQTGILLDKLMVKLPEGSNDLVIEQDYSVAFDNEGYVIITILEGGTIDSSITALKFSGEQLDVDAVDKNDVIGGYDIATGKYTGMECLNQVFPRFRLVPGQLVAPKWSTDSEVAAVMAAKAESINGIFKCNALVDIPTDQVKTYSAAPEWKNKKNYIWKNQQVYWPKIKLGDKVMHMSTQAAAATCSLDADNSDIPYWTPSNINYQMDAAVLEDGTEIFLELLQSNYLAGEGICTALNFDGGWKAWGERTACYPSNTDPKDAFICVRRMYNWRENTFTLTYWQKVDNPMDERLINIIVYSENTVLNGLAARGFILSGSRLEFLKTENPLTDLIDGVIKFHYYLTPPVPARDIEGIFEFDTNLYNNLFN